MSTLSFHALHPYARPSRGRGQPKRTREPTEPIRRLPARTGLTHRNQSVPVEDTAENPFLESASNRIPGAFIQSGARRGRTLKRSTTPSASPPPRTTVLARSASAPPTPSPAPVAFRRQPSPVPASVEPLAPEPVQPPLEEYHEPFVPASPASSSLSYVDPAEVVPVPAEEEKKELEEAEEEAEDPELDILSVVAEEASVTADRKSTRLNSSHSGESRMPSSA